MKKKIILSLAIVVIMGMLADSLNAQIRPRRHHRRPTRIKQASAVGFRVGNDFEKDQYFVGGHFWLPLGVFWKFVPSAEYYFTNNDSTRWQFNGDFLFKPRPNGMFYFGGGVAMQFLNTNVSQEKMDFGGNLLVGIDFSQLRNQVMYPYFQARWTFIEKETYFSVLGGINLILK